MRTTIVFESMFGNTEALATEVAQGLRDGGATTTLHRAGDLADHDLHDCDLLVLAAPTHALSSSTVDSRRAAVARGADPRTAETGLREWLDAWPGTDDGVLVPPGRTLPPVAVFDTRARIARHWPGSAARRTARVLTRRGFTVTHVTSFYVEDVTGPVLDGEHERAREWGRALTQAGGRGGGRARTGARRARRRGR